MAPIIPLPGLRGYRDLYTTAVEMARMAQARPGYDPAEVARRSFATLVAAEQASGVSLVHR